VRTDGVLDGGKLETFIRAVAGWTLRTAFESHGGNRGNGGERRVAPGFLRYLRSLRV